MDFVIDSEQAMTALGKRLAQACVDGGCTIFLGGELGAGKTTLARGFLRGFGHVGAVRSPTFTLVEPYEVAGRRIFHFDLYRLAEPEELEYLGARDYFGGDAICLVEWPERGAGWLPAPDLVVAIHVTGVGRAIAIDAKNPRGVQMMARLN